MVLKQALNSLACSHTLVPLDKAKESPQHKSTSFGEATETHVLRNLLRGNQVVLKQHDQVNGESATHIHRGESKKQMALVVTLCFPQNRSGCLRRHFPGGSLVNWMKTDTELAPWPSSPLSGILSFLCFDHLLVVLYCFLSDRSGPGKLPLEAWALFTQSSRRDQRHRHLKLHR